MKLNHFRIWSINFEDTLLFRCCAASKCFKIKESLKIHYKNQDLYALNFISTLIFNPKACLVLIFHRITKKVIYFDTLTMERLIMVEKMVIFITLGWIYALSPENPSSNPPVSFMRLGLFENIPLYIFSVIFLH